MPEEGFEVARAYVVVSADTGEAEAEVSDLESQMAELHGTVTISADTTEASTAITAVAEEADTTHADIHVGADTTEAQAKIAAIGEEANLAGATADLEGLGSAASQTATDLGEAGTAASTLAEDVTAASHDIADFTDRLGLAAQEWHELDQVSNLPGMAEAGTQIQSLSKDLDELTARGGATADELEAMEMRLDSVGDSLNAAEAHMGQFGDGIERVSGDLHNSAGMYKDFEAGLEGVAQAADDAEAALSGGGGGGGGGITGLITSLFESGGGLSGVAGIAGSLSAGVGAAAAFLAVMTEIGAVVTGVSAAIIGLGPAVLLAIPSIDEIKAAFKDTGAELDKLPASERDIVLGVRDIKTEYDKLAKSFAPDVFKIFDEGVKIANNLLKEAKPLADAAATGIEGILKQADKFTASKGFKDWLKQITPDIAPSLKAIGTLIGTIAVDWGKFMARFSPADIKNAFHILDNLVNWFATGFGRAISNVMIMWDDFSAAFKNTKNWVDDVVRDFKIGISRHRTSGGRRGLRGGEGLG